MSENQRPQSDQAMAAKLIRALIAGRAASDVIVLQDNYRNSERQWDEFRAAEAVFKRLLAELGQDFAGGRALAKQISSQRSLVATPFVFFTRKGNRLDAIEAYEHIKALSVRIDGPGG